jgi:hypothetical protein
MDGAGDRKCRQKNVGSKKIEDQLKLLVSERSGAHR